MEHGSALPSVVSPVVVCSPFSRLVRLAGCRKPILMVMRGAPFALGPPRPPALAARPCAAWHPPAYCQPPRAWHHTHSPRMRLGSVGSHITEELLSLKEFLSARGYGAASEGCFPWCGRAATLPREAAWSAGGSDRDVVLARPLLHHSREVLDLWVAARLKHAEISLRVSLRSWCAITF